MKQREHQLKPARLLSARLAAIAAALLTLGLLAASSAPAAYEQTDIFAGAGTLPEKEFVFPEETQLGGLGGMAVNRTGAGGVPAGTVYAATISGWTARYNPDGEFREAWSFGAPWNGSPVRRCGPEGEPALPVCESTGSNGTPSPHTEYSPNDVDVQVDQTTGYVYVFNLPPTTTEPGHQTIAIFSADGSEVIARFGEQAIYHFDPKTGESEYVATAPEKIHSSGFGAIALDDSDGTLYVADIDFPNGPSGIEYNRLMVFKPQSPGDYEHYAYTGAEHDIWAGNPGKFPAFPRKPVTDDAGHVYIAGDQYIAKLDPSQPSGAPLCQLKFKKGGIFGITVNPVSEEVFFFSQRDQKIHQLSAGCGEGGEYSETGSFGLTPEREFITGMAINPERQFDPDRPPGVLYAGAPGGSGGNTKGTLREGSQGYIFAPPVALPPVVVSESVSHVSASGASLGAQINPKGSPARYAFQYLTEAAYKEAGESFTGATEVPLGGALLGEGQKALNAVAPLSGLSPDTAYRFRVIATSHCFSDDPEEVCEAKGAARAFRTFPTEAAGLPDNRAWELVSPAQKNGGQVFPAQPSISSCGASECKPGFTYERYPIQVAADGDSIVYRGSPFNPAEGTVFENQYLAKRTAAGWQSANLAPMLLSLKGGSYAAFNPDLSKGVLYQSTFALSPEAPSEFMNIYTQPSADPLALAALLTAEPPNRLARGAGSFSLTYTGASADLSRIFFAANDALTAETPFAPEAEDGGPGKKNLYEWSDGQLRLVNVLPGNAETHAGAGFVFGVSLASKARTAVNAISTDGSRAFWSDEAGQLYVREDGEVTKPIPGAGQFLFASADGSKVLRSDGSLYDLEAEESTDLTQGKGGFGVLAGQSDDLSHLYFTDTAVLDEAPNERGEVAEAGKANLYSWDRGTIRFIARLAATDTSHGSWENFGPPEASPNGRWLAFISKAPLSGQDNTGSCEESFGTVLQAPCPEAFLYDSASAKLTCASCNPAGMAPLGTTRLREIPTAVNQPQNRFLTDSGRLYFDSQDSLVVADTNEGVEDVYQYEPNGVGTCEREAGCISLISAGREAIDSNLVVVDDEGKNVFFTTRDQLALKDRDDLVDLYVAREDGGIASETETARGECQGEACAAAIVPPNDPTPGSSSFEGAGNVDERKASKKHKHKKKHAKKHKKHKSHKSSHGRANDNRGGAK